MVKGYLPRGQLKITLDTLTFLGIEYDDFFFKVRYASWISCTNYIKIQTLSSIHFKKNIFEFSHKNLIIKFPSKRQVESFSNFTLLKILMSRNHFPLGKQWHFIVIVSRAHLRGKGLIYSKKFPIKYT